MTEESVWDGDCTFIKKTKEELDEGGSQTEIKVSEEIPIMINALKAIYKKKLLPYEKRFKYDEFASPHLKDAYFEAKPFVLLIGQYSVGKTTFIRYLLERDFPGVRIGPEPTTDRFMVLMHGPADRTIPGNALCADESKPFTQLTKFGMGFLNKFECAECKSPILEKVSFIDTPGILSGEKQRTGRGYEFPVMCEWFAGRCDRILLLFDAHKLDISDEMKATIDRIRSSDEKIRVVLNKADVPTQQLVRIYGALMWSLGKVFQTPEVLRVYVGSFWDKPLKNQENAALMDLEEKDLLSDLRTLPHNVAIRKVNELIKRARRAKIHAQIIVHLKTKMPTFGKVKAQKKILENLGAQFKEVMEKNGVPKNDFPNMKRFGETLSRFPIDKFPNMNKKENQELEDMLSKDMPKLMSMVPSEMADDEAESKDNVLNPFLFRNDTAMQAVTWAIKGGQKTSFGVEFASLPQTTGKVSGQDCMTPFLKLGLQKDMLSAIWAHADMDSDGWLDIDEFCVARFIIDAVKNNELSDGVPERLPDAIVPPSKRYLFRIEGETK